MPQNSEDLPIKQDNATTALPTCQTAARSRKSPASPPLGHLLVPRSGFFCYPGQRKGNPHAGCAVSLETGAGAFPTAGGVRRMARKRGSAVGTADFSPHPKPRSAVPDNRSPKLFGKSCPIYRRVKGAGSWERCALRSGDCFNAGLPKAAGLETAPAPRYGTFRVGRSS